MPRPLLAALCLLACAACIERAPGSLNKRASFDRADAAPYLVAAPSPQVPMHALFGNAIELVGADVAPVPPIAPGQTVTIIFYWKAIDELDTSYRVFVHLDGREGQERIHGDHDVAGGRFPTDVWRKGDIVRDRFSVTIPGWFRGQALDAWIGWYNGDDRLPLSNAAQVKNDGNNRLLAFTLPIQQ